MLEAHGLAAKKALGQNFLVNDGVLQKIVALADVGPQDVVLEVGPGIGTLTIALLKHAARVVSVERDADLPAVLADTCAPWADRFALVEKTRSHSPRTTCGRRWQRGDVPGRAGRQGRGACVQIRRTVGQA